MSPPSFASCLFLRKDSSHTPLSSHPKKESDANRIVLHHRAQSAAFRVRRPMISRKTARRFRCKWKNVIEVFANILEHQMLAVVHVQRHSSAAHAAKGLALPTAPL